MRILVTRPQPDADDTAQDLHRRGHAALVAPLLEVRFSGPPASLPEAAAIVVTSRNGVRALERWPEARGWRDRPAFATGPATGRALGRLGFSDVRLGGGDVRGLKAAVIRDLRPQHGPILYPAARDRTGNLEDELAARGYDVRAVEAYRADPVAALPAVAERALRDGALDGILLYSRRTATAFHDLARAAGLAEAIGRPEYFVISASVAEVVRTFASAIRVAAAPDEDSILALVPGRVP